MIQTLSGVLGGGKTFTASGWICDHLAVGGVVATNINLQEEPFEDQFGVKIGLRSVLLKKYGWELQEGQIIRLRDDHYVEYEDPKTGKRWEVPEIQTFYKLVPRGTPDRPVLVVIDEAHVHFPQDGYKQIPNECFKFLTLSRHNSVDVLLLSQHVKNMWNQFRRLSEFHILVRDMQKHGLLVPIGPFSITLPWIAPQFLRCKYDNTGSSLLEKRYVYKDSLIYQVYKSPDIAAGFEMAEQQNSFANVGRKGKAGKWYDFKARVYKMVGGDQFKDVRKFVYVMLSVMLLLQGCSVATKKKAESLQKKKESAASAVSSRSKSDGKKTSSETYVQTVRLNNLSVAKVKELSFKKVNIGGVGQFAVLEGDKSAVESAIKVIRQIDEQRVAIQLSSVLVSVTTSNSKESGLDILYSSLISADQGVSVSWDGSSALSVFGDFNASLKLLSTDSRVSIDSRPYLVLLDGETGSISYGQSYPVVSDTQTTDGTVTSSYEYEDIGLAVQYTPHYVDGSYEVEVTQRADDIASYSTIDGNQVPIIDSRTFVSSVRLDEGQTMYLGGLKKVQKENVEERVPLLSSIPLVGRLFVSKYDEDRVVELMLGLTAKKTL